MAINIPARLRAIQKSLGLSTEKFARSISAVGGFEITTSGLRSSLSGRTKSIDVRLILAVCKATGTKVDVLLDEDKEPCSPQVSKRESLLQRFKLALVTLDEKEVEIAVLSLEARMGFRDDGSGRAPATQGQRLTPFDRYRDRIRKGDELARERPPRRHWRNVPRRRWPEWARTYASTKAPTTSG